MAARAASGSDARSVWRLGAALGAAGDARRLRPRLLEVAFRALGRTRESGRELEAGLSNSCGSGGIRTSAGLNPFED